MTIRNLITTFDEGLIMTCRLPLFSALNMLLRASLRTLTLTILKIQAAADKHHNIKLMGGGKVCTSIKVQGETEQKICQIAALFVELNKDTNSRYSRKHQNSICLCANCAYKVLSIEKEQQQRLHG